MTSKVFETAVAAGSPLAGSRQPHGRLPRANYRSLPHIAAQRESVGCEHDDGRAVVFMLDGPPVEWRVAHCQMAGIHYLAEMS